MYAFSIIHYIYHSDFHLHYYVAAYSMLSCIYQTAFLPFHKILQLFCNLGFLNHHHHIFIEHQSVASSNKQYCYSQMSVQSRNPTHSPTWPALEVVRWPCIHAWSLSIAVQPTRPHEQERIKTRCIRPENPNGPSYLANRLHVPSQGICQQVHTWTTLISEHKVCYATLASCLRFYTTSTSPQCDTYS